RAPRHRPPAVRDAQRRAHSAHRRRHLRHRGQPHDAHRRRPGDPARRRHAVEPREPRGPEMTESEPTAAEVKEQLLAVAKEMLVSGLVQGTAGNVAARLPDGNVVLTPSSLDYLEMDLDDLVVCSPDGEVVEGHRGPTSEKALHLAAMRRYPEINATMHCHAKHCTMFALTRRPIPAVIEEFVVYVGGDVPVANYQTTGTDELAE